MRAHKTTMHVNAFFGDDEIELSFPESWEVTECRMAGHDRPALNDDEMRQVLRNPIGTPRLSDMARDKKQVCILFDDLPKPTPASRIAPFVLEELRAGGLDDEHIRFVCAPGTHRALTYPEFVAKLGREIVEKYRVYNHSIWQNLVHVGQTTRGTPVHVNREFVSCDLRVGIGGLLRHGAAGFGGGAKIILPGVAGIDTIVHHHEHMLENTGVNRIEGNVFRLDLEEAARLAGLHFKVDAVLNNRREVVGLFAGDFVAEHRAAVDLARELYRSETVEDADVLVVNTYPNESQMGRAMWCIPSSLREGGDVVLLTYSHDGQILHQLSSRFGTDYGGRLYHPDRYSFRQFEKAERVFTLAPHLSLCDRDEMAPPGKLVWCKSWAEVLAELVVRHGPGTNVGVYPYASMQIGVSDLA